MVKKIKHKFENIELGDQQLIRIQLETALEMYEPGEKAQEYIRSWSKSAGLDIVKMLIQPTLVHSTFTKAADYVESTKKFQIPLRDVDDEGEGVYRVGTRYPNYENTSYTYKHNMRNADGDLRTKLEESEGVVDWCAMLIIFNSINTL